MKRIGLLAWLSAIVLVMISFMGCSGSIGSGGNDMGVQPRSVTLSPGQQQLFTCNIPVTWRVVENGGGTITTAGLYSAPGVLGNFTVEATSTADTTRKATAVVTVSSGTTGTSVAAPLADAAYLNRPYGANLLRWNGMGYRVIAYLIYRDTNIQAPIAVLEAGSTYYLDDATPLPRPGDRMESTAYDIEIDPNTGAVQNFDYTTTYDTTLDDLRNPDMSLADTNLSITARRVPLAAGETCGYQFRVLFVEYDTTEPGHPDTYKLILGNMGAVSTRVSLTQPPPLYTPADGEAPLDGIFRCERVAKALSYTLQVSSSPIFPSGQTVTLSAPIESANYATATLSLNSLWNSFTGSHGQPLYWRMGARIDGGPIPVSLSYPNTAGWVYSPTRYFTLPLSPPEVTKSGRDASTVARPFVLTINRRVTK